MTKPRRSAALLLVTAVQLAACTPMGRHPLEVLPETARVVPAVEAPDPTALLDRDEPSPSFLPVDGDGP